MEMLRSKRRTSSFTSSLNQLGGNKAASSGSQSASINGTGAKPKRPLAKPAWDVRSFN